MAIFDGNGEVASHLVERGRAFAVTGARPRALLLWSMAAIYRALMYVRVLVNMIMSPKSISAHCDTSPLSKLSPPLLQL